MKERFNQIFGHVAFLPMHGISIWALDTYFETRRKLFVCRLDQVLLAYSLVIVFLTHFRQPKTDDSGQSED